jgi:hypothetical protein
MRFMQRAAVGPSAGLRDEMEIRPWQPSGWSDPIYATDTYLAIDERVGTTIGVVAAPWPSVDAAGLRFAGTMTAAWFDAAELQSRIDALRQQVGQVVRPLRISDAFWVRGFDTSLDAWEALRDITSDARAFAKGAVATASVGIVSPTDLFEPAPPDDSDAPPPPPAETMTARPTV